MKRQIFSLFLLLLTLVACGDKPLDPNKPVYVKIKTTMGDVTVLLYDDTPLHRDNFIKLCQSNEYEGMLFHRVIKEFVVQGGDPESKAHEPGALYGDGDGGYTVPAEILPNHFNKKGALIDAKDRCRESGTCFRRYAVLFCARESLGRQGACGERGSYQRIRRNWLYYKFRMS